MNAQRVTADDFFTGLFAALALRGTSTVSLRGDRFDRAVEHVFDTFRDRATHLGFNIRFRIRTDRFHNDSAVVRDSITAAAQRDLISLDNPEFQDIRLKISTNEANAILESVPGGETIFAPLAEQFMKEYRAEL